ncbi:hypothetical protein OBJ96_00350 [Empedobacter falsenii]
MKEYIIITIFLVSFFCFGQKVDTIKLKETNITSFKKDKNFIENKGILSNVNVHSTSSIVTSIFSKKDITIRGIEFYFGSTDSNVCDEFVSKLEIFDENFINVIKGNEIYYVVDSSLEQKKIFNLEKYEIKLDKNKKYYIGLEFEPSDNCKKFIFQAVNSKNLTTIIDSKIIKSTTSNTYRDVGIRYRIYYK